MNLLGRKSSVPDVTASAPVTVLNAYAVVDFLRVVSLYFDLEFSFTS